MKTKKCCYIDRECTPACVAYSVANELSEGAEGIGMSDMHCMRLLLELADLMNMSGAMDSEDFEEKDEF